VLVEFDGVPVATIYDFTHALRSKRPGDTVTVVVVRGGERVTAEVTLGRRQ
jgi:S1-C subfamily serine protease